MSIVRNPNEETRYRQAAMSRLRRSDVALDELGKLYDNLSERELRAEIIRIIGQREEPAATDKLLEIARTGTDPNLRRAAISALARKNDPRTTKLLLELVEK
jgi:HEAT repeat protein